MPYYGDFREFEADYVANRKNMDALMVRQFTNREDVLTYTEIRRNMDHQYLCFARDLHDK